MKSGKAAKTALLCSRGNPRSVEFEQTGLFWKLIRAHLRVCLSCLLDSLATLELATLFIQLRVLGLNLK